MLSKEQSNFTIGYTSHLLQDNVAHHRKLPYLIPEYNRQLELSADTFEYLKDKSPQAQHLNNTQLALILTYWNQFASINNYPQFPFDSILKAANEFKQLMLNELLAIVANKLLYKSSMTKYGPCNTSDWSRASSVYNKSRDLSEHITKMLISGVNTANINDFIEVRVLESYLCS
ncbi:hypothetical protein RCL1_003095 [Eukaryota sp. TZLM3-RCL]